MMIKVTFSDEKLCEAAIAYRLSTLTVSATMGDFLNNMGSNPHVCLHQ